jgi:hypothetical protein
LILAHTKSVQCSPVVRACRGSGNQAEPRRRILRSARARRSSRPAAPRRGPHLPRTSLLPPALPAPTPPAFARFPRRVPPPALPILGAVETGAGVSGASGTALGLIAWRRRSRYDR